MQYNRPLGLVWQDCPAHHKKHKPTTPSELLHSPVHLSDYSQSTVNLLLLSLYCQSTVSLLSVYSMASFC